MDNGSDPDTKRMVATVGMWNRICSRVAQKEDFAAVCIDEGLSPQVVNRHMDGIDQWNILPDPSWMRDRLDAALDVANPPPPPFKGHSVEKLLSIIRQYEQSAKKVDDGD